MPVTAFGNCHGYTAPLLPSHAHNPPLIWKEVKIKRGDSLYSLMERFNVRYKDVFRLLKQSPVSKQLISLKSGEVITVGFHPATCAFQIASMWRGYDSRVEIFYRDRELRSRVRKIPLQVRRYYHEIVVKGSLFYDGLNEGVPGAVLIQLEDIMGGHLNFLTDTHPGDTLELIYEQKYVDDEEIRQRSISAMRYRGKAGEWKVVKFVDGNGRSGYFTLDGKSMETAFNRNPVYQARISSHYSKRRYHPILHRIRAHKGVDFAAPIGTPVHATGHGVVAAIKRSPTYGLAIKLRHGRRYETFYAHLSGIRRGIRTGSKVKKGQVIAYVGTSGLSTGPHLHYEFLVNGRHVDPMRTRLPLGRPIRSEDFREFERQSAERWQTLQQHSVARAIKVAAK